MTIYHRKLFTVNTLGLEKYFKDEFKNGDDSIKKSIPFRKLLNTNSLDTEQMNKNANASKVLKSFYLKIYRLLYQ